MAVVTYGIDYDGTTISDKTKKQELKTHLLLGSSSPLRNDLCNRIYPNWKGHLLVGSLKFQYLELVKLDGTKVIGRQKSH
jgi:hypothetical protein